MSEQRVDPLLSFEEFHRFCPGLDEDDFLLLQPYLKVRIYRAGEIVIEEAEKVDAVGFLLAGELVMRKEGRFAGKYILIGRLTAGSIYGEQAASGLSPAPVSITAAGDCRAIVLARSDIDKLFNKYPKTGLKLVNCFMDVACTRLESLVARVAHIL